MIKDSCNCNMDPCEDPCKIYPFKGIDFTAEEINSLLKSIQNKVDRGEVQDGLSAYKIAVANGYQGTEEQWLASLRGPRGNALTFQDLTPDQVAELQSPATQAAENLNKESQVVMEGVKKDTQEAVDNANKAAELAEENSMIQWYPTVASNGDLSWSRNPTVNPPAKVNIKGPAGRDGLSGSTDNIIVVKDLNGEGSEGTKSYVLGAEVGPEIKKNIEETNSKFLGLEIKVESQKTEVDAAKEEALQQISNSEQSAISNFNAQRVTPEMLSESTKQLIEASGGGTINNLADDEDIQSKTNEIGVSVMKFADREYNPVNYSGKGYKILRKNIVDGRNVLTQEMINVANTRYIIQYDFDLNEKEITIPEGCILDFQGGNFSNGFIKGDNIKILNKDDINFTYNKIIESNKTEKASYPVYQKKLSLNDENVIFVKTILSESPTTIQESLSNDYNAQPVLDIQGKRVLMLDNNKYYKTWNTICLDSMEDYMTNTSDEWKCKTGYIYCQFDSSKAYYFDGNSFSAYTITNRNSTFKTFANIDNIIKLIGDGFCTDWLNTVPGDNILDIREAKIKAVNPRTNGDLTTIRGGSIPFRLLYNEMSYKDINVFRYNIDRIYTKDNNDFRINVTNFGIDNTGRTDVSKALNRLFLYITKNFASYSTINPIIYFPKGTYLISEPLYINYNGYNIRNGCTLLGDGYVGSDSTVLKFVPKKKDITMINTISGKFNVKGFSLKCVDEDGNKIANVTRLSNNFPSPTNGIKNFHTFSVKSGLEHINCVNLLGSIEDCYIEGFSGIGINVLEGFTKIRNVQIYDCGIGISAITIGADYNSDTIISNFVIHNCKFGLFVNKWIKLTDGWIDEICEYAITTNIFDSSWINRPNDSSTELSLNAALLHLNHIDKCAIYCGSLSGIIQGVFNRCNCNYAGFTYDLIKEVSENKEQDRINCALIYASSFNNLYATITTSNGYIGDDSSVADRQKCGVLFLVGNTITNSKVYIGGANNSDIFGNFTNAEHINNLTYFKKDNKLYHFNPINNSDIINGGTAIQRPTNIDIGFQFFDTTLNKPIWWNGTKWVSSEGTTIE